MGTGLAPGASLGPYRLEQAIGSGGMGAVYKARDTRLDRTVAIKILVPDAEQPAALRERFEREARAISQLNHPNVCTLYDIGEQPPARPGDAPVRYLVMEYLDGETLAQRLERGALPLDQALTYAAQIAEALDRVHRAGIVHGDLKPGNIMLTRTGVKLLDFGLARQQRHAPPAGWSDAVTGAFPTLPAGTLVGTLQYLAPEQIEGRESDVRSDIFACGAVIYEMVTGRKAFPGETHASVMASVLNQQPLPLKTYQPAASPALEHVVATCLAKDPEARWQHAGDLARQLRWVASAPRDEAPRPGATRALVGTALAVALLAAAVVALVVYLQRETIPAPMVYRTSLLLPEGLRFPGAAELGGFERFALSPDGRYLAFVAIDASGNQRLWVRPLDSLTATPLAGTDGATSPFWSPDSRRIAFVARGQLRTISPDGGSPVLVAAPAFGTSGTWNSDDVILFTPTPFSPLHQVPASGGTPRPVTTLDESRDEILHRNPFFLPDGRHFLYVSVTARDGGTTGPRGVYLASLDDPSAPLAQLIDSGSMAKFAMGHVLFVRDDMLLAQPFDVRARAFVGEPRPVSGQLELTGPSSAAFSVSAGGTLVYLGALGPGSQLVWTDRDGRPVSTLGEAARYGDLELSPDGRQAIVSVLDPRTNTRDLWVFDVERGVRTRFTVDPADDVSPIWSRDSARVVFASNRRGHFDLYQKPASGLGDATLVHADDAEKYPTSWLPDGDTVLYSTFGAGGGRLSAVSLAGEEAPRVVLDAPVTQARLSPDGRWLAYVSGESGQPEVYVVPFPGVSRRWQVSSAGGSYPRWTRDGREIVFAGRDNRLMSVDVDPVGEELNPAAPRALFEAQPVAPRAFFAVAPDGERVLLNTLQAEGRPTSITVVQNWAAALAP